MVIVSMPRKVGYELNSLVGKPQLNLFADEGSAAQCAVAACRESEADERLGDDS
jgi:hypothetical protein